MKNTIQKEAAPRICVVDGVSTGLQLAKELHMLGFDVAHVASKSEYAGVPRTPAGKRVFSTGFVFADNLDELVHEMRNWRPQFIVAGSEPGVELTDLLNAELAIPQGNSPHTTPWRRDKYAMHERLRESGIRHARQIRTKDRDSLADWLIEHGEYPIVVKPVNSSCSDGVQICDSFEHALTAFDELLGRRNWMGLVNDEVLAQEFLDGTQYIVNTVSWEGAHFTSDIWRLDRRRRPGGAYLMESQSLHPSSGTVETALRTYTDSVLDALGLAYGAGHCEVMWTTAGPVLVEANARTMGACIDTASFTRALGHTQTGILAGAYADPEAFRRRVDAGPYTLQEHVAEVSFIFSHAGKLESFPGRERIEALSSFHSFVGVPEVGTHVTETINTLGTPGYAYFVHPDRSLVENDARIVREWQRENTLFILGDNGKA